MKKNIPYLFWLLLLATAQTIVAQQPSGIPSDPMLRTGTLKNGLRYFIRHNDKPKGRADFYLVQKTGSVQEEESQRGLAHFLEHMAFNGTQHFPGNSLVSELEKKGIKFGYNINASTSYDETIYKLMEIPVTSTGVIDTALLVLHDWSGFLTLDAAEIDKERGVVREEWRTRSTGMLRVLENQIYPAIFAGTPYAKRIPIGNIDVVNTFRPNELKDYYKKWYRPDLQGIIITGDVDVDRTEEKIKELFAAIPAAVSPVQRAYYDVPGNHEPVTVIATDPELRYTNIKIYWKIEQAPVEGSQDFGNFKHRLVNRVISNLLSNRLVKQSESAQYAYSSVMANIDYFEIARRTSALTLQISPGKQANMIVIIKKSLEEVERMRQFGFTHAELEKYKKGQLQLLEMDYAGRNNRENFEYSRKYLQHFMYNEPAASSEWEYQAVKQVLNTLDIDSINYWAKQYVGNNNMVFVIQAPSKDSTLLPKREQLLAAWADVYQSKLAPYENEPEDNSNELMAIATPVPGKVIKTEPKAFGFTQWMLANGAKVLFKNTGYAENTVTLYAYSAGGYSVVSNNDLPSALAVNSLILSTKEISGIDSRANAGARLEKFYESIGGKANDKKDFEVLLRLVYSKMSGLRKDQQAFDRFISEMKTNLTGAGAEPKSIFGDTLNAIMKNHHPRARISLTDSATLAKVDYDKILRIYKERFGSAGDFSFYIAANMPEDSIRPLIETWIGGLPAGKRGEKIINDGALPPRGIVKRHFSVPMTTPATTVTIGYTGKLAYNATNKILMDYLSGILQIIFTETIREKEGGTYGASVDGDMSQHPEGRFIFQVNFDTDPALKDKMVSIVYQEINKLLQQDPGTVEMDKVKKILLKRYENNSEKNGAYWATKAWYLYVFGLDEGEGYDKIISSVTPGQVRLFAKQLIQQGNIIEVIMDPKKN